MLFGGVLPRGCRLELGDAGIRLALRTKRQAADYGGLDVDLARPVAELGGARRIAATTKLFTLLGTYIRRYNGSRYYGKAISTSTSRRSTRRPSL